MAKNFKKGLSLALAAIMCAGTMNVTALAETELDNGNVWYGDDVSIDVKEGKDSYTYMLFGDIPNFYYYETSNHTVKKEVTGGGAVHLLSLIDTAKHNGEWTPELDKSNYDVVYCCDAVTGSEAGDYYKRLNLEDSEYFTVEEAEQLRAIVENSYPYLSVEEAKAALKEAGFEQADELDRSELITATQGAIWSIANAGNGDSYVYNKTATTAQKNTWGGYLHNFSPEIVNFTDSTTSKKYLANPNGVGDRINALREFLLEELGSAEAGKGQIVITDMRFSEPLETTSDDLYTFELTVELNQGATKNDDIVIKTYVDGKRYGDPVNVGKATEYTLEIEAEEDAEVKVVVSGTQKLKKGVYFYAPKAEDVNEDGEATAREVSQNLIGVGMGDTPVYAEAEMSFENVTFKGGSVSNISYMFINKETGDVDFIKKIDVPENAKSAPIIKMDGYVSVMFMKQATSGMFWFSEEVDEELVEDAINCLIDNNPSYKGHNAVVFGRGEHELEFKNNKFVTYTFNAGSVVFGEFDVDVEVNVELDEEEVADAEDEAVAEEEVDADTDADMNEEPAEPTLDVTVEGADVTDWTVIDGVTAIYIKGEGKVPDVIWTSEKVDSDVMAELIDAFDADEDAKILCDLGTHKIQYQHNKNKTKTVTYTFEEV